MRSRNGIHPYELLIKLSNLFDYNINSCINGIVLPTFSRAPQDNDKPAIYAEVMQKLSINDTNKLFGSQLHIGSHTYEKHLPSLFKLIGEKPLRCYETIVNELLENYVGYLTDKYETTCYMRDHDKEKADFYNRMNDISNKLRTSIKDFPRHQMSSWLKSRAYVSFASMAFDVLGHNKFIEHFNEL